MVNPQRRSFIRVVAAAGTALSAGRSAAQAAAKLDEADPQAVALAYKADASKLDKAKYPQHQATQVCGACNFFQGKAGDATAPCQLFGGKLVGAKGWCLAWAKKAA